MKLYTLIFFISLYVIQSNAVKKHQSASDLQNKINKYAQDLSQEEIENLKRIIISVYIEVRMSSLNIPRGKLLNFNLL